MDIIQIKRNQHSGDTVALQKKGESVHAKRWDGTWPHVTADKASSETHEKENSSTYQPKNKVEQRATGPCGRADDSGITWPLIPLLTVSSLMLHKTLDTTREIDDNKKNPIVHVMQGEHLQREKEALNRQT